MNPAIAGWVVLKVLAFVGFCLLWEAVVVTALWSWYVVPLGLPVIGIVHALGLCLLITLVRFDPTRVTLDPLETWQRVAYFVLPAIVLFLGWIFSGWK